MNPHSEVGVCTFDGARVSARVLAYLRAANIDHPEEQPPPRWDGAFLAWLAHRHGLTPPVNPAQAESWRDWGHPVASPEPNSIAIMTAGGGNRVTKVGIVQRVSGGKVYVTGGDFDGKVGTEAVPIDRVIECRKPHQSVGAPVSTAQPIELKISMEHQAMGSAAPPPASLPAPDTIDHVSESELRQLVLKMGMEIASMKRDLNALRGQFETHEHQFVKSDGTVIAFDDLVLRSEVQITRS